MISGRDATQGEAAAKAIRGPGGRATFVTTDVTDDGQVAALAQRAAGDHGVTDIWFNNAGIEGGSPNSRGDSSPRQNVLFGAA